MRLIDADTKITALLYNEEREETEHVEMSVADYLDIGTEEGCPYPNNGLCGDQLYMDALALLKGQETRIMSREEIENADGYFWFEDKAQKVMQARYFQRGILFEIGCLPFASKKLNWKTYGTLWRYWTAMPTDEQRRAAKWDG